MAKKPVLDIDDIIKALAHPLRREMLGWLKNPQKSFPTQVHPFELGVCAGKILRKQTFPNRPFQPTWQLYSKPV
ncbi:MAG: hypothetical protein WDM70_00150 [Nitrosomonadales bacterium]